MNFMNTMFSILRVSFHYLASLAFAYNGGQLYKSSRDFPV